MNIEYKIIIGLRFFVVELVSTGLHRRQTVDPSLLYWCSPGATRPNRDLHGKIRGLCRLSSVTHPGHLPSASIKPWLL